MQPKLKPIAPKSDPSAQSITCEICGQQTTIGDSHSFVVAVSYATTGTGIPQGADGIIFPPIAAFQCDNEQHFCCSKECALTAAHACIDEHLSPKFDTIMAQRQARVVQSS